MRDDDLARVRRGEARACAKKKFFATREAAEAFGRHCVLVFGTEQEPYPCRTCLGWHLAHRPHTYDARGYCGCGKRRP